MRAAVLHAAGETPAAEEFPDPSADDGQLLEVVCAGLNPVDLSLAAGSSYFSAPEVPSVVGREGVGRLEDGTLVYFDSAVKPFGSIAERVAITPGSGFALPDGADPRQAVAFGIAGLAAWLALEQRAQLREGETVLVLGASGTVGHIAVQAARLLGAGRVVAAARSEAGLRRAADLGADATVRLEGDLVEALGVAAGDGFDVVVDPLWGEPVAAAIAHCAPRGRVVQLGQSAGASVELSSSAIRGKALSVLGHTNFFVDREIRAAAHERMVEHGMRGELSVEIEAVALDDVGEAWRRQAESPNVKLVLEP